MFIEERGRSAFLIVTFEELFEFFTRELVVDMMEHPVAFSRYITKVVFLLIILSFVAAQQEHLAEARRRPKREPKVSTLFYHDSINVRS